jgi:acetylornithine deacetylase/succinyl-diaminopimelate desuccinylase-like protein
MKQLDLQIISYQGRPVKWKWMDTPGDLFTELVERFKQTQMDDSELQLTPEEYDHHIQETLITPMTSHQIGCVMALVSASELAANTIVEDRGGGVRLRVSPDSRLSHNLQVLKDMYRRLVQSGLRMICILTKVDLVDGDIEADVAEVQYSETVQRLRECLARETGLPMNQVRSCL